MTKMCLRLLLAAAALIPLGGCAGPATPPASTVSSVTATPPVPVLRPGQEAAIDLFGNGRATVTVTRADLSPSAGGRERLVVTVDIALLKAGKPVTGGPENFGFRDNAQVTHPAQVSDEVAAPRLTTTTFTTAGQTSHGRVFFDVPAGSASAGHVQLMTGNLVHAVWRIGG